MMRRPRRPTLFPYTTLFRSTVADLVEGIEVVGDQEHGEPQRLLQLLGQPVEGRGADRIEAGGRLVEEEQLGVERQRAGEAGDRKSTRLNSSHSSISYAVFCL